MDASGHPIPWYTYPAIEFVRQIDFSGSMIFEFGSGNSTLFWADRVKKLVSVEDDSTWYASVKEKLPEEVDYLFRQGEAEYAGSINNYKDGFDVVVVDGSHRQLCARAALASLRDGGMIILDNSDWYCEVAAELRRADLIEVDMSGFGPINAYTWTTSFFLARDIQLRAGHGFQPVPPPGSVSRRDGLSTT